MKGARHYGKDFSYKDMSLGVVYWYWCPICGAHYIGSAAVE